MCGGLPRVSEEVLLLLPGWLPAYSLVCGTLHPCCSSLLVTCSRTPHISSRVARMYVLSLCCCSLPGILVVLADSSAPGLCSLVCSPAHIQSTKVLTHVLCKPPASTYFPVSFFTTPKPIYFLQLSTTDILAPASMKNAANCET